MRTVVYKQYTRDWKRPLAAPRRASPGPLIRARVGDDIFVHFKNLRPRVQAPALDALPRRPLPVRLRRLVHPRLLRARAATCMPGKTFTYPLRAGADSAGVWPYHDHSPSMMDSIAGGMYGAISILRPRRAARRPRVRTFFESHLGFKTINGRAFVGNTPVFHARVGDRVQWDVMALGDDHHTFHVHGHRWRDPDGTPDRHADRRPARELHRSAWREDPPGTWLYHCHVEDHMMRGMIGLYRVRVRRALAAAAPALAARARRRRRRAEHVVDMPGKYFTPPRHDAAGRRHRHVDEHRHGSGTTSPWSGAPSTAGSMATGARFCSRSSQPGHFAYHCTIHPFMAGTLDVYAFQLQGPDQPSRPAPARCAACPGRHEPCADRAAPARRQLGAESRSPSRADGSFRARSVARLPASTGRPRTAARASRSGCRSARVSTRRQAAEGRPLRDPRHRPARAGGRPGRAAALLAERFRWRQVAHTRVDRHSRASFVSARPAATRRASCCCGRGGYGASVGPVRHIGPPGQAAAAPHAAQRMPHMHH